MVKNKAQAGECFRLEDLLSVIRQELDDAREEYNRLSDLLVRYDEDDESYIHGDYVEDLQEYIYEIEDLTDNIDRLIDVRNRLSDNMEQLNDKFKQFGLL